MATGLKRTTYSLKRITESETAAVKPMRVRIVEASSGVTTDHLAESMDVGAYEKEWLELLNAGIDFSNLADGTRIKIVQE